MARTVAELPKGSRITDYISLGVLNTMIPRTAVDAALEASSRQSIRQRDLPAHVMVYYVIALALYMQSSYREVLRCLLEGLEWLSDPSARPRVVGRSGISQARTRLGAEPLQALHDAVVRPVGRSSEPGCGYRRWHLVSIDGSGLDVADEQGNADAFGRPGASRGASAFPQIRFVSLVENGTHVLFGSRLAGCAVGEQRLARDVVPALSAGMLCLADRNFSSYPLWNQARATGADLLWRIKRNLRLPRETPLADGSYLSRIYPSQRDRRHQLRGVCVRVIEYQLSGVVDAEPLYRLLTTVLDAEDAPARELAALYHERWEIETAFDDVLLRNTIRAPRRWVFNSHSAPASSPRTPDAPTRPIRALMYEAARQRGDDPDGLSYVHAVRVIRRDIITHGAVPPSTPSQVPPTGAR